MPDLLDDILAERAAAPAPTRDLLDDIMDERNASPPAASTSVSPANAPEVAATAPPPRRPGRVGGASPSAIAGRAEGAQPVSRAAVRQGFLNTLEQEGWLGSFTTAASGAVDKGLYRNEQGQWNPPIMAQVSPEPTLTDRAGQIAAALAQKTGGRLDQAGSGINAEGLRGTLDRFQQQTGMSDEGVKEVWQDAVALYRPWGADEHVRTLSDGALVPNPQDSTWLDPQKAGEMIGNLDATPEAKAQLMAKLPQLAEALSNAKLEGYEAAASAVNQASAAGSLGSLGLTRLAAGRMESPSEWAERTGRTGAGFGSPEFIRDYEREVIDPVGGPRKFIRGLTGKGLTGWNKLATTVLGVVGGVSDASAQLAAAGAEAGGVINQGLPDTGLAGSAMEEAPSLLAQYFSGQALGALAGAVMGAGRAAQATTAAGIYLTAGAQSYGMQIADDLAEGKPIEKARENAMRAGISATITSAALGAGALGGVEAAAAGNIGSATIRDLLNAAKAQGVRNIYKQPELRKFVQETVLAGVGERLQEQTDQFLQEFLTADPDTSLADAWDNSVKAGNVATILGAGAHVMGGAMVDTAADMALDAQVDAPDVAKVAADEVAAARRVAAAATTETLTDTDTPEGDVQGDFGITRQTDDRDTEMGTEGGPSLPQSQPVAVQSQVGGTETGASAGDVGADDRATQRGTAGLASEPLESSGEPLIFGRTWEQIQRMQQGDRPPALGPVDALRHAQKIVEDVRRFQIPVDASVVSRYELTLPNGYVREGDLYVYRPEQSSTPAPPDVAPPSQPGQGEVPQQGGAAGVAPVLPPHETGAGAGVGRFAPDDVLTMRSAFTNEDTEVSYRGPDPQDETKSVVWTGRTQMSVPTMWLRRPGTEPAEPAPAETIPHTASAPAEALPLPTTKKGLIDELAGPIPRDYQSRVRREKTVKALSKFKLAELRERVVDARARDAEYARLSDITLANNYALNPEVDAAGRSWAAKLKEIGARYGIDFTLAPGGKGDSIYKLSRWLAEKGVDLRTPTTPPTNEDEAQRQGQGQGQGLQVAPATEPAAAAPDEGAAAEPIFTRGEIEVGQVRSRTKRREAGTDGERWAEVRAPGKVLTPENWSRVDDSKLSAFVSAHYDFASRKAPKKTDRSWVVRAGTHAVPKEVLARGLTFAEAVERAKDHVESANPQPNEATTQDQVPQAGSPATLEGQPTQQAPAGEAQARAAQRGGEGAQGAEVVGREVPHAGTIAESLPAIREALPGYTPVFRIGDFHEFFGDDADLTGTAVTKRGGLRMSGVPPHQLSALQDIANRTGRPLAVITGNSVSEVVQPEPPVSPAGENAAAGEEVAPEATVAQDGSIPPVEERDYPAKDSPTSPASLPDDTPIDQSDLDTNTQALRGGQDPLLGLPSKAAPAPPSTSGPVNVPFPTAQTPGYGDPISAPEVITTLERVLRVVGSNAPIRLGRMAKRSALGTYHTRESLIRLRKANDTSTAAHEVAHAMEDALWGLGHRFDKDKSVPAGAKSELVRLGKALYGATRPAGGYHSEGFAEFVRIYVEGGAAMAAAEAPTFAAWFKANALDPNPRLTQSLAVSQDAARRFREQGSLERGRQGIAETPGRTARVIESGREFLRGIQPKLIDMLHVYDTFTKTAAANLGKPVAPEDDPWQSATARRLIHHAVVDGWINHGMTDFFFNPTGVKPLKDAFAPVRGRMEDFILYLWARRTVALAPSGRESGLSLADAQEIIRVLDSTKFRRAAADVYAWNDGVLDYAAQASPDFQAAVDAIRAKDPGQYIPLQREFKAFDERYSGMTGSYKGRSLVKHLKGSTRRIKNPVESMIARATAIVLKANQRYTMEQAIRLADRTPGMGNMIFEVPVDKLPAAARSVEDLLRSSLAAARATGASPETEAALETALDELGMDDPAVAEALVTFFAPAQIPKTGENPVVPIFMGGKRRWFEVSKDMYEALGGMEMYRLPKVIDMTLGATARGLRLGTTGLRAAFTLAINPLRDFSTLHLNSQSSAANKVVPVRMFLTWLRTMGEEFATVMSDGAYRSEWGKLFDRLGAKMANQLAQDTLATKRAARRLNESTLQRLGDVRNWVDFTRDVLQFPESATRITELRLLARDNGWTPAMTLDASTAHAMLNAAKQVTTDFTAGGSVGRVVNQASPFFNAQIQGPRAHVRAARRAPVAFFGRALLHTAQALALWWTYKDEDWWIEMPESLKYGYTYVPFTGKDGTKELLRIPRSFEADGLFMAGAQALADSAYRRDPENMTAWFNQFLSGFQPSLPPIFEDIYEQGANKDIYFDRPIVPRSEENLPPEEQFGDYTTTLAVKLGEIFKVSPRRIDHSIRSYFGGTGGDIAASLGRGGEWFAGAERGDAPSDFPVYGTLFVREGAAPRESKSIDDLYERLDHAVGVQRSRRVEETPKQRQGRLLLDDAAAAIGFASEVAHRTEDRKAKQQIYRVRAQIARDAVKAYDSDDIRRGQFTVWKRRWESELRRAEAELKRTGVK